VDEKRLKEILDRIPEAAYEFEVIDQDSVMDQIFDEGKHFLNQKVLYPLPTDDLVPWVHDFIMRERLRREWGAIIMDTCKVLDRQHVDLVVIPAWAQR